MTCPVYKSLVYCMQVMQDSAGFDLWQTARAWHTNWVLSSRRSEISVPRTRIHICTYMYAYITAEPNILVCTWVPTLLNNQKRVDFGITEYIEHPTIYQDHVTAFQNICIRMFAFPPDWHVICAQCCDNFEVWSKSSRCVLIFRGKISHSSLTPGKLS